MGNKMKYSEEEMAALLNEIETEFGEFLGKSEAVAETTAEAATEEEGSEESTEQVEGFNYSAEDYAEMDELYSSMSKSEAEAHLQSLKKTLGEVEEAVEATDLVKSEVESKKDEEIAELKKTNEELRKSIDSLTDGLTKFVKRGASAPKQKAVTQIQYIAKSEEDVVETKKTEEKVDITKLSKNDIAKRLTAKIRSGNLEKSERDKINDYYDGEADIDSIKHLL